MINEDWAQLKWSGGLDRWTFGAEMEYAKALVGGYVLRNCPHILAIPHSQLLKNYVRSAKRRIKWGTYVDGGEEIIRWVQSKIQESE